MHVRALALTLTHTHTHTHTHTYVCGQHAHTQAPGPKNIQLYHQNIHPFQECYEQGHGVPQNYQEARRLYALGVNEGVAEATESLERVEELMRNDPTHAMTKANPNKKPKRNEPCFCGSGKKYTKCCGR